MLKRLLLIVTILVSCVGCDQATKSLAKMYLSETESVSLLGGSIHIEAAQNRGAFLSMGASMPQSLRTTLLTVGVGAVLIAIFGYAVVSVPGNALVVPAFGLVIGGGASNLIDRLLSGGYVFDFLNMGIGPVRTGVFNVADTFILAGVLLLLFGDWLSKALLARRAG